MIIEIVPSGGIGGQQPFAIAASQVVIKMDDGTPVTVAFEMGNRAIRISKVGDKDFEPALRELGLPDTVICDELQLSKPSPGARLIAGPY